MHTALFFLLSFFLYAESIAVHSTGKTKTVEEKQKNKVFQQKKRAEQVLIIQGAKNWPLENLYEDDSLVKAYRQKLREFLARLAQYRENSGNISYKNRHAQTNRYTSRISDYKQKILLRKISLYDVSVYDNKETQKLAVNVLQELDSLTPIEASIFSYILPI